MHRRFATLVVTTLAVSAFGQGQVNFNNYVPGATPPVNAPIEYYPGGPGAGSVHGMKAQLFLVGAGNARTAVGDTTTFRTSPPGAQYYINGITVVVPGIEPGQSATFVLRAYNGTTYESSTRYGQTAPVTITLGGGTSVPADLTGLKGFWVALPEPSTMVLAALGGGLFLMRRWRSKAVQSNASETR